MTAEVESTFRPSREQAVKVLVSGITGQVGSGFMEAVETMSAAGSRIEIVGLVRRRARANIKMDGVPIRQIIGDVTSEDWGLGESDIERMGEIDVVVDLAGLVDWTAPQSAMDSINYLGAMNGLALARRLSALRGQAVPYIYASTAYVAGMAFGSIPESLHPADASRTPYELSKWLAEHHLIRSSAVDHYPVLIARIGGVIGSSATRSTTRRSSLYQLVSPMSSGRMPVFPIRDAGRVDILPRDVIGEGFVRLIRVGIDDKFALWRGGRIVHLCAGHYAPTMSALLSVLQSKDVDGRYKLPRLVRLPDSVLRSAENIGLKYVRWNREVGNRLHGLRYVSVDRIFERNRLLTLTGGWWPTTQMEQIVDIAFGFVSDDRPVAEPELPMGRFQ